MSSNKPSAIHTDNEEIDLRELWAILRKYRLSIGIITFLTFLSTAIFVYFSTSTYEASLTLKTQQLASSQKNADDPILAAIDAQIEQNTDDEITVLQSYTVAQKALSKLNIANRYFLYNNFKSVEMYKESPFVVEAVAITESLIGKTFYVEPVDSNRFRLSLKPSLREKLLNGLGLSGPKSKPIAFSGIYTYGTPIETPNFRLTVHKRSPMEASLYGFSITPNEYLASDILQNLKVSAISEKGTAIALSYQDNVPERAQEILNAIAEAYKEESVETKIGSAKRTLEFIDHQLQNVNIALQSSATNLEKYKSSHIVIEPQQQGIISTTKLTDLQSQQNSIDLQLSVLEGLLNHIESHRDSMGIDIGSLSSLSPTIVSLIEKIQNADAARTTLLIDYTDKHPSIIKVNEQLSKLRSNLRATLETSIRGLRQQKEKLLDIIREHQTALEAIPQQEKELNQLSNNFAVNQKVYEYLLQKRAETAITQSSTVSTVRIIDQAMVGADPVKPKKLLILIVGLIIGLVIGVIQAFFRNFIKNTIQNVHDLERHTSLPILSVLPYFSRKRTLYDNALRLLLTKVQFGLIGSSHQVITFSSSIPGEGRTTTALEFARIAAKNHKKVIMLDLDLQNSRLRSYTSAPVPTYTLSDLLYNGKLIAETAYPLSDRLDIVFAGEQSEDPYDMFMSDEFAVLLKELRSVYHLIILLSPPTGLVADALVLMRLSDLSLIVLKAEYSKKDFIHNINRFVDEYDLKNVGIVLNSVPLSKIRPWKKA